jgi:hypothetical protein
MQKKGHHYHYRAGEKKKNKRKKTPSRDEDDARSQPRRETLTNDKSRGYRYDYRKQQD